MRCFRQLRTRSEADGSTAGSGAGPARSGHEPAARRPEPPDPDGPGREPPRAGRVRPQRHPARHPQDLGERRRASRRPGRTTADRAFGRVQSGGPAGAGRTGGASHRPGRRPGRPPGADSRRSTAARRGAAGRRRPLHSPARRLGLRRRPHTDAAAHPARGNPLRGAGPAGPRQPRGPPDRRALQPLLTSSPNHHPNEGKPMTTTAVAAPVRTDDDAAHRQILKVMTGLLAALFTAMLSTTIVSTALPTIMSDLNGTQRQYTWVITASLLAMTISTPIWGKLSDLFNKKVLVQLSIVLFVAGSVGAGLSQTVPPMMAFRALQGLAMGGLIALTQSIMGALIPPRQRGRYSGYMGAVMAVSTVSGPLLGGLISDNASWRWCFFVCVPLAVLALVALQITLHPPAARGHARIDYLGAALIAVVAALPMLWVTFAGSDYAWISWQSAAFLAGFVVAVTLAVVTELRAAEPMVPIRLLGNRTTAKMIVASTAVGFGMFGSGTF